MDSDSENLTFVTFSTKTIILSIVLLAVVIVFLFYFLCTKCDNSTPTFPPTFPPTLPPTEPPTLPPTEPPTEPPTLPPTEPPTLPPTESTGLGTGIIILIVIVCFIAVGFVYYFISNSTSYRHYPVPIESSSIGRHQPQQFFISSSSGVSTPEQRSFRDFRSGSIQKPYSLSLLN